MPWLRKYRIRADEDFGFSKSKSKQSSLSNESSVSRSQHDETVGALMMQIESLKNELGAMKTQLTAAEAKSSEGNMQQLDMEGYLFDNNDQPQSLDSEDDVYEDDVSNVDHQPESPGIESSTSKDIASPIFPTDII